MVLSVDSIILAPICVVLHTDMRKLEIRISLFHTD